MRLFALVPDGGLFRWVAAAAARRWVGVLLAGCAFAVDGLTGRPAMDFGIRGLLDEPAHLATALIMLGALTRVRGVPPDQRFGWTMLACSVLIDLDHLPGEFGSDMLTNGTPRPYPHALWTVLALTLAWAIARFFVNRAGRSRPATVEFILAGAAWGVAAHFVRDIVTAPMSFWWPVSDIAVEVPYWWYVAALAVMIAIGPIRRGGRSGDPAHLPGRRVRRAGQGGRALVRVVVPAVGLTAWSGDIGGSRSSSARICAPHRAVLS